MGFVAFCQQNGIEVVRMADDMVIGDEDILEADVGGQLHVVAHLQIGRGHRDAGLMHVGEQHGQGLAGLAQHQDQIALRGRRDGCGVHGGLLR